jgi:hypothetical protein
LGASGKTGARPASSLRGPEIQVRHPDVSDSGRDRLEESVQTQRSRKKHRTHSLTKRPFQPECSPRTGSKSDCVLHNDKKRFKEETSK